MKKSELKAISDRYSDDNDNITLEFAYISQSYRQRMYVWVVRTLNGDFTAIVKGEGLFTVTNSTDNVAELINNNLMLRDDEFNSLEFIKEYRGWIPCE